jgi:hypothetical protein
MRKPLVVVCTLVLLLIAAAAWAAPKATAPWGQLQLSAAAKVTPAHGDAVSLDAAYAGLRKQDTVRVQLLCFQDVGVVYGDAVTLSESPRSVSFVLGVNSATATSVWTDGAARCEGDLFYISPAGGGTVHYLDSLTFDASG